MRAIAIIAWLIVSVVALFISENNASAQVTPKPVKPYVFNKDLRALPPAPPTTQKALPLKINPGFQPSPPRPMGGPDPLWHPGKKASETPKVVHGAAPAIHNSLAQFRHDPTGGRPP